MGTGGLVPSGKAAHPAVTSMDTRGSNTQLSLSHARTYARMYAQMHANIHTQTMHTPGALNRDSNRLIPIKLHKPIWLT